MRGTILSVVGAMVCLASCIKAPAVVMLDQQTALEQQAGGEYPSLEHDLRSKGLSPKGQDFTGSQLEAAGLQAGGSMTTLLQIYSSVSTDAELLDELLVKRCVGEALTGFLDETPNTCTQGPSPQIIAGLVQRANRSRDQLWSYIQSQRGGVGREEVVKAWREHHLLDVVCGGQVQQGSQAWQIKACE